MARMKQTARKSTGGRAPRTAPTGGASAAAASTTAASTAASTASTTAASEAVAVGSGSDDTDAGTAVASSEAAAINTSQPPLPGLKVTFVTPPDTPGVGWIPIFLSDIFAGSIHSLLVAGFTTVAGDARRVLNGLSPLGGNSLFRIQNTDKGRIPVIVTDVPRAFVIVTDVPISLDRIHRTGMTAREVRAVAMIDTEQNGDIAYLTTHESHRKRGFGKACVYAAVTYFAGQGKKDLKIFSKTDTIDFWETQCGFNTVGPSGEDSGSGSGSATEEHEGAAAAAAGSSTKSAKGMKTPATRLTCVTMEGKVDDVLEKLKGKTMSGYAYILNPQKDWIMPVDIPGRVEIPGRVVLKRPASAAAAAADSGGSVVKKPRKEPKDPKLHEAMLEENSGASDIAASANPIVAASPTPKPTGAAANSGASGIAASVGSEALGQGAGMVGGQPATCANPKSFDDCLQNPTGNIKQKTMTWRKTYYHHVLLSKKDDHVRKSYLRANKQSNPEQTFNVERKHVVSAKKLEADADEGDRVTSFAGRPLMCPNCWQHFITPMLD